MEMKTAYLKTLAAILLLTLQINFTSCLKDVNVNTKNVKQLPVINAAFTQDSVWKVNVTLSAVPGGPLPVDVNNAIVKIFSANQLIEQLVYKDSGNYISPSLKKPLPQVKYSVEVQVPGFETVQAQDSMPAALQTVSIIYDSIKILHTPSTSADPVEVNPVLAIFTDLESAKKYYMLKPYYYEINELLIYKVTRKTLDSASRYGFLFPGDSARLAALLDIPFNGITAMQKYFRQLYPNFQILERIFPYFNTTIRHNVYNQSFYKQHLAYSNDILFTHFDDYFVSTFGVKGNGMSLNNYPLQLFFRANISLNTENGIPVRKEAEFYLEVNTMSEVAYKYYTSYLQHIKGRTDPFSEPTNVYSNVKNGYGIFCAINSYLLKVK
jgi:Domain of unknown function (DUF4249)